MEPVTHLLTGACLARSGLHRRVAYATVGMVVAAEFPDIDTLWGLRGPVAGFEHHRGITHTFVGVPVEAALLLLCVWLWHMWRRQKTDGAPVRWGALYFCLLLALLSHLLLDYTNNYGLRPFFPFNPHWYAASIVFIFDPLLFAMLLGGVLLPELFALVGQEVQGHGVRFRSPGWARAALVGMVLLWGLRAWEHGQALRIAALQTMRAPGAGTAAATDAEVEAARPLLLGRRSLASPDPVSPFRWYTATDFGPVYLLGTADTRLGTLAAGPMLNKGAASPALVAAEGSTLGRVYLDWSSMPWVTASADGRGGGTTVTFADVRFLGDSPWLRRGSQPPLTGFVELNGSGEVVAEGMDGRAQR